MPEERKQNYLHGATILLASMTIIKILGAIYKVPLYNILDKYGTADFNVAYQIYNLLATLSTAGLPIALARMIAEEHTLGRENQVKRTYHVAYMTFLVLGAAGTLILFFFSGNLASVMSDPTATLSIRALSPVVLLVCLMSAYRGYAEGHSDMVPTAVSQVIETALKMIVGLAAAWILIAAKRSSSVAAAGAILGASFGGAAALIYLIFSKRKSVRTALHEQFIDKPEPGKKTFSRLLSIGIPIALGASVMAIMTLIDTGLVMWRLQSVQYGLGMSLNEARALFGEYTYAQTLFNAPTFLVPAFTISIVPAIAGLAVKKRREEIRDVAETGLRVSTVLNLPMAVGMVVLANPIIRVLYTDSTAVGVDILYVLGLASFFVCTTLMTTSILQASGHERLPMFSMIAGAIVEIVLNLVLVGIPEINILGSAIDTVGCYVTITALNLVFLRGTMVKRIRMSKVISRPLIASLAMGAAAWAVYGLLDKLLLSGENPGRMLMALCLLITIVVAVAVYLVLVVLIRALTVEDISLLPKGKKLAKLLHMK